MNALTKAFVVVVTILAVVLVALVIPFAARVENYKASYDQLDQKYKSQLAAANDTANKIRNEIAAQGTELESANNSNIALKSELAQANNNVKTLEAQNAQLQLTLDRSAAGLEISTRTNATQRDQIDKQSTQLQEQIAKIAELTNQKSDLSQVLIDARGQIRRLSDNFRRIQEENKSLEQQLLEKTALLKTATEKLAVFEANAETDIALETDRKPDPGVVIRGTVTQISDDSTTGIVLVQVNVGTRDLVKEGMEFIVSRGDDYVGKIKITTLDTAASVGQLTIGGGVQEGDQVRAGNR